MKTELPCGCCMRKDKDIPTQYMFCEEHKQSISLVQTAIQNLQRHQEEGKEYV